MLINYEKPTIITKRELCLTLRVMHVFRANFNDTYFLEKVVIDLKDLNKDELTWIDPYNGKSKINNTLIALAYCSDDEYVILEKTGEVIKEHEERELYMDVICCEDFDDSVLLASHIGIQTKK